MADHFHALTVEESVPETDEAVSIRFAVPYELKDQYCFKAGQHLTVMAIIDEYCINLGTECATVSIKATV